jgi:hypothetical protein
MAFDDIASLKDLKEDPYVARHIVWDFEPRQLMQPCVCSAKAESTRDKITGYLFYIETMDEKPGLFLMRHTANGCAETIAKIEEIPYNLLSEAMAENEDKKYGGMYPINSRIKSWLKNEFGIGQKQ